MKSEYEALLNRLDEMQQSPYYAAARTTLAVAETTIYSLERQLIEARAEKAQLTLSLAEMDTTARRLAEELSASYSPDFGVMLREAFNLGDAT